MARVRPTARQRAVLAALAAGAGPTTRALWAALGAGTGKRALERLLGRLQARGWVTRQPLRPYAGAASPQAWALTAAGAALIGAPRPPRAAVPERVAPGQAAVLHLLAAQKALTTAQIAGYLYPDKPPRYTAAVLRGLRARGLLRAARVAPERGAVSAAYWRLRPAGARAVGRPYGPQHARPPTRGALRDRGAHLALCAAVEAAGWQVIAPVTYHRGHPRPAATPQRLQLLATLAARGHTAEDGSGDPAAWAAGLVPAGLNDYVAVLPHRPALAVVLIVHPWRAGESFWLGRAAARPGARGGRRASRVALYARLAPLVPVWAVFPQPEIRALYADRLARHGLGAHLLDAVGALLAERARAGAG